MKQKTIKNIIDKQKDENIVLTSEKFKPLKYGGKFTHLNPNKIITSQYLRHIIISASLNKHTSLQ